MTISNQEQKRYERMASLEEQADGTGTGGTSLSGAAAADLGRQLLVDALGSAEAVNRALRGGRPNLDGQSGSGEASPTIRVRVSESRKRDLETLKAQMHQPSTSDVVRAALDEYVANHLQKA